MPRTANNSPGLVIASLELVIAPPFFPVVIIDTRAFFSFVETESNHRAHQSFLFLLVDGKGKSLLLKATKVNSFFRIFWSFCAMFVSNSSLQTLFSKKFFYLHILLQRIFEMNFQNITIKNFKICIPKIAAFYTLKNK